MLDMSGVYALLVGILIMAILGVAWFQFVRWQHARRTQATVAAGLRHHAQHFASVRSDHGSVGDLYVSGDSLWFVANGLLSRAVGFQRSGARPVSPFGDNVCTVTDVRWLASDVAISGLRLGLVPWNLTLYGLRAEARDAIIATDLMTPHFDNVE